MEPATATTSASTNLERILLVIDNSPLEFGRRSNKHRPLHLVLLLTPRTNALSAIIQSLCTSQQQLCGQTTAYWMKLRKCCTAPLISSSLSLPLNAVILPMPFSVALIISASFIFFTSGSVTGFTFIALPAPESAIPVAPWHIWHLAL